MQFLNPVRGRSRILAYFNEFLVTYQGGFWGGQIYPPPVNFFCHFTHILGQQIPVINDYPQLA